MAHYDEHLITLRRQCREYGHCRQHDGGVVSYYLAKDSVAANPWMNPNETPNVGFIR